jgi:magnesium-transporting ATPase (P-type)
MIHSLECKHFTKSLFQVNLLDNKVLLWCVVVLSLMTFPVVYIPRINDDVFLVGSLTWEWGIVVSDTGPALISNHNTPNSNHGPSPSLGARSARLGVCVCTCASVWRSLILPLSSG